MNLVRCLLVSVCGALLLSSCEIVPPQLRTLICKNLPAGEERLRAIQQALTDQGYDPGPLDGQMGHKTREALRQFQADKGLPATGTADAATREALGFCKESTGATPAATAPVAATHPSTGALRIQEAQRLLTEHGYAPGPADGVMGSKTREALKLFQNDKGLAVSGRLDAETLEALRSPVKPAQTEPENQPATILPSALPLPVPAAAPPESTDDSTLPVPSMPTPSGIMPPPPVPQTPEPSPEIAPLPPVSSAPAPSQETTAGNGQAGASAPAVAEQAPPQNPAGSMEK